MKLNLDRFSTTTVLAGLVFLLFTGCNRGSLRIPGASTVFPDAATQYKAQKQFPYTLFVALPEDHRKEHEGEPVAGTKWKSAKTDALWTDANRLIQERLVKELTASRMFTEVTTRTPEPKDLVLKTDLNVFSSQARGFLIIRVVGMSALHVSLGRDGKVFSEGNYQKVVTDADKEYTGSQATMIEQAMRVTMADSLRETMKDMLKQIEADMARRETQ